MFGTVYYSLISGSWNNVYAALDVRGDQKQVQCFLGTTTVQTNSSDSLTLPSPLSISVTDVVRIGGNSTFIGQVASLIIYSPGTLTILGINLLRIFSINCLKDSCSANVGIQAGITSPPVIATCNTGTMLSNGTCTSLCTSSYAASSTGPPTTCASKQLLRYS